MTMLRDGCHHRKAKASGTTYNYTISLAVLMLATLMPGYGQVRDGGRIEEEQRGTITLSQSERWCLFRSMGNSDACNSVFQQLKNRTGFADLGELSKSICRAIEKASNYNALGNTDGFAEGGTLAFDGEMSIRSVMNQNGSCMLYTGEYPTGYQDFTTGDTKDNCTNMVLNNVEGKWIVARSNLIRCKRENRRLPRLEVQKRVGVLRPNRLVGASFVLGEIAIPKQY